MPCLRTGFWSGVWLVGFPWFSSPLFYFFRARYFGYFQSCVSLTRISNLPGRFCSAIRKAAPQPTYRYRPSRVWLKVWCLHPQICSTSVTLIIFSPVISIPGFKTGAQFCKTPLSRTSCCLLFLTESLFRIIFNHFKEFFYNGFTMAIFLRRRNYA